MGYVVSVVIWFGLVSLCVLCESDFNVVMVIELCGYFFFWIRGIFIDCLCVGYFGLVMECDGLLIGYGVFSIVVDEVYVFNICIDLLV